MNKLITSPAPHYRKKRNTTGVMGDVLLALLPAAIMAVYTFGTRALILLLVCILSSVLFEHAYSLLIKKKSPIKDLSAVVTGTLLAFCLPSHLPIWMAAFGSAVAIIATKQLFGGLGKNFANPALVGRIVLLVSFGTAMGQQYVDPNLMSSTQKMAVSLGGEIDAVIGATPLAVGGETSDVFSMILGQHGGSIGEVCAVALIIGLIYLLVKKVITITIPASFLGTMVVIALIAKENPLFHVLAGGALLGAIFMATDYVTSPTTESGKLIFGILCGAFTMIIRLFSEMPEGVSYAILLANVLTPYIDHLTRTKPLGGLKTNE